MSRVLDDPVTIVGERTCRLDHQFERHSHPWSRTSLVMPRTSRSSPSSVCVATRPPTRSCRVSPGRFAAELERRGIQKGDRVLLWGENGAPWIAAFFGCVLRGVVAVPIDARRLAGFCRKGPSRCPTALGQPVPEITSPPSISKRQSSPSKTSNRCFRNAVTRAREGSQRPRHAANYLHVRNHRRAEGRRPHASQRAGQPAAHRVGDAAVPEV